VRASAGDDTEKQVRGYPNALHKGFRSIQEAASWLEAELDQEPKPRPQCAVGGAGAGVVAQSPPLKRRHTTGHLMTPPTAKLARSTGHRAASAAAELRFDQPGGGVQEEDLEQALDLHPKQREVVGACLSGGNVFFSGPGGTGKTVVVRYTLRELRKQCSLQCAACLGGDVSRGNRHTTKQVAVVELPPSSAAARRCTTWQAAASRPACTT